MPAPRSHSRVTALAVFAFAAVWSACTDPDPTAPLTEASFQAQQAQDVRAAIAAQDRHTDALLRIPGVVGTAVGLNPSGRPVVRIFAAHGDVRGVPTELDGVPAQLEVTGLLMARSDPTTRQRPAPLGFSVGHPAITAGTIGALVVDGSGNRYILSNNHVLANGNNATVGDPTLQPGPYDGGTLADQIGTLSAFKPIVFTSTANNTIDAAIAATSDVTNSTPTDDGYGTPSGTIWGDANGDGVFDNRNALLNLPVQKYGRTTKHTTGTVTGVNATLTICYEALLGIFCMKSARFVDQIVIEPGSFSDGGDSGSLIVTNDANLNPVALLFAGSTTQTIANRIDHVLNEFNVSIDSGTAPPPTPLTDVAITGVSAPSSVTEGATVDIQVTVRNVGNQDVVGPVAVALQDETDGVPIGDSQNVADLAPGAQTTLTFVWNTTGGSTGTHTLTASHDFADENTSNDQASATSTVNAPGTGDGIHVGDLDGWSSGSGRTWSATVEVTVHDASHNPINGATVLGVWNPAGLASDECTTGELGGSGTCIFLFPSLRRGTKNVTFTVTSVTMAGHTYLASENHDVDGSSNGTVVTVNRP